MTTHHISDAATVTAILSSDSVTPPDREGSGATIELRRAMARFADPTRHARLRSEVTTAVDGVPIDLAVAHAARVTARMLGSTDTAELDELDALAVARTAPVAAIGLALDLWDADDVVATERVVGEVDDVAAVDRSGSVDEPDRGRIQRTAARARRRPARHSGGDRVVALPVTRRNRRVDRRHAPRRRDQGAEGGCRAAHCSGRDRALQLRFLVDRHR